MNLTPEDRIRSAYTGWFFGPGAILRKELTDTYWNIQQHPAWGRITCFADIPSDHKMYDQLTQTLIVHRILINHGQVTPELFATELLRLNEEDQILTNDQYGPSTQSAVRKLLAGADPRTAGQDGLTTGAAMRGIPIALRFWKKDHEPELIHNTVEAALITHGSDIAIDSSLATNLMIARLVAGLTPRRALYETLETLQSLRGHFGKPTAMARIDSRINVALELTAHKNPGHTTRIIAESIGTSWYANEAIPAAFAVYFATKDAQEAALMSFHLGYNHTIPEIACAFHGAEKGPSQFPTDILQRIEETNGFSITQLSDEILSFID